MDAAAVRQFISSRELDQPYVEPGGASGIFAVWRDHERHCILGLMGSSLPGTSVAAGTPLGAYVESHSYDQPLRNFLGMGYGAWWMMKHHPLYAVLFFGGGLVIWALFGGAICRLAAVQFARDEKLTAAQGFSFARTRWFGGYFLAPCIPLVFAAGIMAVLVLGGVLLRFPVLGDLLAGVLFFLALLGGFLIATLLVGLLIGGSLFWPAVATEGSDAFDAFSRALSYPLSRPLKAIIYAVLTVVYASVCWVFVNLFTYFALAITHTIVSFGTSPFGWWSRGAGGAEVSKLDLLWPIGGPNVLHRWPDWSQLTWYEHLSALLIWVYVAAVIGLMWSFLASFYFSGSTVVYALLRRDVDAIDLDEVFVEDVAPIGADRLASPPSVPPDNEKDISLPIAGATGLPGQ